MAKFISPYQVKDLVSTLDSKANLNSPVFTGTPTAPTPDTSSNDGSIATTEFVKNALSSGGVVISGDPDDDTLTINLKGTIGDATATVQQLPAVHKVGWLYKVITEGTYSGHICEVGDLIICTVDGDTDNTNDWLVIQTNIDRAVSGPTQSTNNNIVIFDGNDGKKIKDSGVSLASLSNAINVSKTIIDFTEDDERWSEGVNEDLYYELVIEGYDTSKYVIEVLALDHNMYRHTLTDLSYSENYLILYSPDKFTGRIILI